MIALILTLILVALLLQVFCLSQLTTTERPRPKVVRAPVEKEPEERKTALGRPIRIIKING
jgi:hypothetical protein